MLKALFLSLAILTLAATATAQNLVPNGGFEDTTNCNLPEGQYEFMLGLARPWFSPNWATPDVYTSNAEVACGVDISPGGLNPVYSGLRYAGIAVYGNTLNDGGTKEYLAIRLSQELVLGQTYRVSAHVARATFARFSVDTFGVHFSADSLYLEAYSRLPVTPQVRFATAGHFSSLGWVEVLGYYTAMGGERYLYMGSFEEDSAMDCAYDPSFGGNDMAYYMVDEVEVRAVYVGVEESAKGGIAAYVHQGILYWPGHRSVTLTIHDAAGRRIGRSLGPRNIEGGLMLPIELVNGLYLVQVSDAAGHAVLRWVKE